MIEETEKQTALHACFLKLAKLRLHTMLTDGPTWKLFDACRVWAEEPGWHDAEAFGDALRAVLATALFEAMGERIRKVTRATKQAREEKQS